MSSSAEIKAKIGPVLEKVVNKLLATKPEDPIGHFIHYLEVENGTATIPLSKDEKMELKNLRHKFKQLKAKEEQAKEEEDHSHSESDEDEYVDELPESQQKAKQGTQRTSVSSEAFGVFNRKSAFVPTVIEKDEAVKAEIK